MIFLFIAVSLGHPCRAIVGSPVKSGPWLRRMMQSFKGGIGVSLWRRRSTWITREDKRTREGTLDVGLTSPD